MSPSFLIMPGIYIFCSSTRSLPQQSSSSGDLLPEMMESETPPPASPSNRADDFEVSSRRVSPDQQVVQGMMKMLPEGDTSVAQGPGNNDEGPEQSGIQTDRNERNPTKGGRTPTTASRDPEAPDILKNMLRQVSISKEHRTLMGTVMEKVLSVKSGLNEAFMGLLRGFEVCTVKFSIRVLFHKMHLCIDSIP